MAAYNFCRLVIVVCVVAPYEPSYSSIQIGYVIKLGVILPYEGDYPWTMKKTRPAIEYAIDRIRNQSDLLPGIAIQIKTGDSKCSETYGPLAAIDFYVNRSVQVFIGPACDYALAPIARFTYHWNIPIITGGALVQAFKAKRQYPLLTRISSSYAKLGDCMSVFMNQFEWTSVGMIYTDNHIAYPKGRSDCYFTMEGVYEGLQRKYKAQYPDGDIWREYFDERVKVSTNNGYLQCNCYT